MILLTIGTQLPFDRLVKAMDELALSLDEPIFGQIGTDAQYIPKNFEYVRSMRPPEFSEKFGATRVVVSHAGIGTLLSARKYGTPIVVVPRQAKFGEHRNDHQLATCRQLEGKRGVYVALDTDALAEVVRRPVLDVPASVEESPDRAKLLQGLRQFASGVKRRR